MRSMRTFLTLLKKHMCELKGNLVLDILSTFPFHGMLSSWVCQTAHLYILTKSCQDAKTFFMLSMLNGGFGFGHRICFLSLSEKVWRLVTRRYA